MTGAVLDRPGARCAGALEPACPSPVTLEARLTSVLDATRTSGSAECPVCHARMTRIYSTRAGARASAACDGCGSRLS
jgi:hypothetical protein